MFLPASNIIHLFGYSTKQRIQKQTVNKLLIERYRGMFHYFQKHYGPLKLFLLRIIVLQGFGFRLIFSYVKLLISPKQKRNVVKDNIINLKKILSLIRETNFDWRKTI